VKAAHLGFGDGRCGVVFEATLSPIAPTHVLVPMRQLQL
jgi:hypothetical protein